MWALSWDEGYSGRDLRRRMNVYAVHGQLSYTDGTVAKHGEPTDKLVVGYVPEFQQEPQHAGLAQPDESLSSLGVNTSQNEVDNATQQIESTHTTIRKVVIMMPPNQRNNR